MSVGIDGAKEIGSMQGTGPLIEAIKSNDISRVATLLAEHPALATARADGEFTPLLLSTYLRNEAMVRLLLDHGAVPGVHEAAALGRIDLLSDILAAEGDALGAVSRDGWTALHLAAHFGHPETVRFLLTEGADLRTRSTNPSGNTALHAAAAGGSLDALTVLLAAHADPDALDAQGNTALHVAAANGSVPIVKALLATGAAAQVRNQDGKTPAGFATERGHAEVVALLA